MTPSTLYFINSGFELVWTYSAFDQLGSVCVVVSMHNRRGLVLAQRSHVFFQGFSFVYIVIVQVET